MIINKNLYIYASVEVFIYNTLSKFTTVKGIKYSKTKARVRT